MIEIKTPLSDETIKCLKAGDMVFLSGKIITARDAAHKKLSELIQAGEPLVPELEGKLRDLAVFYAGPSQAKHGKIIGSIGPTTAGRMDLYSPLLISMGLKVMIGKGLRSDSVREAIIKYGGIYLAAIGGAAALMAKCVKSSKIIAFEELGTEAIRELEVERLPLVVAIDSRGENLYEKGIEKYKR